MPTATLPLVGSFNTRGIDGSAALVLNEDQRFLNVTLNVVQNPVTGKAVVYAEKRPGWGVDSMVSTGIASTGLIKPQAFNAPLSAFGETNSNVYVGTVNVGVITGRALHLTETLISASSYVALKSSDGTGWYYPDGAKDTLTYTGDTISGDLRVTTTAILSGVYSGQLITGGQMGAGARVTSVNQATSTIGLNVAATATSTGAIITKEPIAKILSANFVSSTVYQSAFAPLDGYLFYATDNGDLNNSDLNSVHLYTSGAKIAVQQSPDPTIGIAVQKNTVVAFGLNSNEKFSNAGYGSGSPLQVQKSLVEHIGALDQRSLTTIEDDIYYVSTPSEGDVGVYRMRGLASTRVSTPNVDRILGTSANNGAIYASSFKLGGYTYAAFTVSLAQDGPASNFLLESGDILLLESTPGGNLLLEDLAGQAASFVRMLVLNTQLNVWTEWDCDESTFIDSIGSGTTNQLLATSRFKTDGKVYTINPVVSGQIYTDDGSAFTMEIRTSKIDFGTGKKKFIEEVELIGTDIRAANTPYLSYSDDDYQTFSTPRAFSVANGKVSLERLGSHRGGRAYKITDSSNAPFRASALKIRYREGLS